MTRDFARCRGVGNNKDGWREGCENCARRLAPASGDVPNMEPPYIIVFWCEYHIPIDMSDLEVSGGER